MVTPDRNKTLSTRQITAAVVLWLDNHGFKPIETEVFVTRGWQADIAGLIDFTEGEAINLHLAPRKPNWKMSDEKYRLTREAFETAYKALPSPTTLLVEVKSSLSDLKGDRKWKELSPTELRYVAVPPELLTAALPIVPLPWGILKVTKQGVGVVRWAGIDRIISVEERLGVVYDIAIRRDHRTRHKALRESQKLARATHNQERLTPDRWNSIARTVLTICKGGGEYLPYACVEEVLKANQVGFLPEHTVEQLRKLWAIARPPAAAETGDTISPVI